MELIRGKTFIKGYAQHPPEKVPIVVYKGKKNVEIGKNFNDCDIRGKTFIKSYTQNPPEKVPTVVCKEKKNVEPQKNVIECDSKKNAAQTQRMSNGICTKEADIVRCPRFIRKSRTYDCVISDDKPEKATGQITQGRIPNSVSSPGLVEDQGRKRNDTEANKAPCKQNMIDYRNFVPQMPFVPSVAKSLPRKRISLRKSKKSFKNIFNLKKNKQQDVISEDESQPMMFKKKETKAGEKQYQLGIGEMPSDEFLLHDCSDRDMYIEAVDSFKALCEDVTSLKSFDSLTGCGEIIADESASFIDIENSRVTFISKPSSIAASFQGGVERLASPAKSESIDFSRLRGHMNSSANSVCSNVLSESNRPLVCQGLSKIEMNGRLSIDQVSILSYSDLMSSNENIHDADSPMSTSDEGYYDSHSPTLEEGKNEVGNARPFPRDSYSGDALYELFSDSCEKKLWPVPDSDLSAPGHNNDNPTSIYSFCVGSDENMAPQPALGLVAEDNLESTWKGRECLLKLCDTELSLTIGMVNWLRKTGKITENDQNVTCSSEEPPGTRNENDSKVEEISAMSGDSKGETFSHCESVTMEYTEHVNSRKGNIDSVANTFAEISKPTTDSDNSKFEKNSPFVTHVVLSDPPPKLNSLDNITEYKEQFELANPYANALAPVVASQEPNVMDVSLLVNHLDCLQPMDFQCLIYSISKNNRWLADILEKCPADDTPLQILFGHQRILDCLGKVMRPYDIAQNIKNSVERLRPSEQTSQFTIDSRVKKTNLITDPQQLNSICRKEFGRDYTSNQQCLVRTSRLLPKETNASKDGIRPGFLPLFKSTCSSVISRCSSVLYRVRNSEDAVIYFDTRTHNLLPESNDKLAQNSSASSVDYSKYTEDGFLSITSTTFTKDSDIMNKADTPPKGGGSLELVILLAIHTRFVNDKK